MAKARKTVDLDSLISFINDKLRVTSDRDFPSYEAARIYREGYVIMAQHFLMEANAYKGFSYLTTHEVGHDREHARPGINIDSNREIVGDHAGRFLGTDNTRIQFFH